MLINLVFDENEAVTRIRKKIKLYLEKTNSVRKYDDTIWLENMYISFDERLVTINVYNMSTNWKAIVSRIFNSIIEGEQVYISSSNGDKHYAQYFEKFSSETDSMYLEENIINYSESTLEYSEELKKLKRFLEGTSKYNERLLSGENIDSIFEKYLVEKSWGHIIYDAKSGSKIDDELNMMAYAYAKLASEKAISDNVSHGEIINRIYRMQRK